MMEKKTKFEGTSKREGTVIKNFNRNIKKRKEKHDLGIRHQFLKTTPS